MGLVGLRVNTTLFYMWKRPHSGEKPHLGPDNTDSDGKDFRLGGTANKPW